MNCIIRSWRCTTCFREEFFSQPPKKHFSGGKLCHGDWICYEWNRGRKPLQFSEGKQ